MIAIQTKYLPATNTRGARIKAWTPMSKSSCTIPYDYSKNTCFCHFEAVKALRDKYDFEWDIEAMRYGVTEQGYVFCFNESTVV